MTLDLLHNKIIKETHTKGFEKSVNDNLIPKLYALYGTSLDGVQFYEDYINDDFIKDGYWYYPLTVVIDGIYAILWIKWDISRSVEFEDGNPYAFVGDGVIDFVLADDIPIAFKNAIEGRSNFFEGGYVKLNVTTDAPNTKILAGKYSQTFVDEMNRQLSYAISRACGVKGLPESSIELDIVFAPNTYMEHTSENVTYRRLLISAKGCSARDFWIKWTRKNSSVAFSVNDNVTADDIVFEIGEDVSQKIREKEYRFLVYGNSDKYRVAMGRKNVTEWRELIKRAVKRGELEKTTAELEENAHVAEVSDKLSEILEKCGVTIPASTSNDIRVDAEVANEALRLAVLGGGADESEDYVPEISVSAENAIAEEIAETVIEQTESIEDSEELPELEVEVYEDALSDVEAMAENNTVFDNLPDEENAEFDFGKTGDAFEIAEENVEELSFEDILNQFIPKSDIEEEEENEEISAVESVDISDVDESEAVRFNISKLDGVPFDVEEQTIGAEENYEDNSLEENSDEEDASEEETEETEVVVEYDETKEILEALVTQESVEEASVSNEDVFRLENEIANLKHQLEIERIAKEEAESKLEEAFVAKINAENELTAEREGRREAEEKLRSALASKESAENRINLELVASQELRAQNEKQKFAIDQVKRLVEEETAARNGAEAELELLRSQIEELKADNEHLKEIARVSEEACREAEAKCKHHERELINQIELAEKERVREKNLFAEAARQAKEENEQRFAELKEAEIARIEEEARIEALRRAEDERLRLQDALALGNLSKEKRKKDIEDRAREARLRMEEKARLDADAKANAWDSYISTTAPVYENVHANEQIGTCDAVCDNEYDEAAAVYVEEAPVAKPITAPVVNYNYTSYIVRLMFRRSADPNVTARIHEMISYALTEFGKEEIYMKVKASMPDNSTVILNFVKFPEEEFDLLIKIINYLGKSDLGVYKVVLD